MNKLKIFLCVSFLLLSAMKIYAQVTHTVTTNADAGTGSLRQIIAVANSGDSIVFAPNVNHIILTSGQIEINKNLTIDGGNDTTKKVTIDADRNSRIFYVDSDLNFDINNLILTKGGHIQYIDAAVRIQNNTTFTATNCNFIENRAGNSSGAVSVQHNSTFTATNCNFVGNRSSFAGAVARIAYNSTFIADNCNFTGNLSSDYGVIFITDTSIFIATNCDFTENCGAIGSGAIEVRISSIVTAENCNFYKNYNTNGDWGRGGAVSLIGSVTFTAINCIFAENFSVGIAGAIHIWGSAILTATDCIFIGNTATSGGAIHFQYATIPNRINTSTIVNCYFIDNVATNDGGAIGTSIYNSIDTNDVFLIATDCVFIGNTATSGGAIHSASNTFNFIANNCIFVDNVATNDGGAIRMNRYGNLSSNGNGIGLVAENCIFTNNLASDGGAINISTNVSSTIENCIFTNNSASNNGGAINIGTNASSTIENCIFTDNNATSNGGIMYINNSTVAVENCTFTKNTATAGGAVCILSSTFTAENCTFNENTANVGGVIWGLFNSTLTATNCTFNKNSATNDGGAFYLFSNTCSTYLYHCTFNMNQATMNNGNGISNNDGILHSYNCIYAGNIPQIQGSIAAGKNLIEGIDGVTSDLVFGNNQFNSATGYIIPLVYAVSATQLDNSIAVSQEITADEILTKLTIDQAENARPIVPSSSTVTFGSIEVKPVMLTVATTAGGTTNPTGTSAKDSGIVALLTATANDCYEFKHWVDSVGNIVSTANPLSVTMEIDTFLTAIFEKLNFDLTLTNAPQEVGTVMGSGRYACGDTVEILAIANADCYEFKHWVNGDGSFVSSENPLLVTLRSDTLLTAIFGKINFDLVLTSFPQNAGTIMGSGRYACGDTVEVFAILQDDCYEFVNWVNENGDAISSKNPLTVAISSDTSLVATFKYLCIQFTIRASEHKLIDPRIKDYEIPIYIQADDDVSNATIEKLVIEIDRSLFFPKSIDNGIFVSNDNGLLTFGNMRVPTLQANQETILLTVRGDVILADKDSGGIFIKSVEFLEIVKKVPELINGYITLDICEEGSGRLLTFFDYEPSVTVKNNPVITNILEIECKVIENGNYILEIVDLQGKVATVAKWTVTSDGEQTFDFEIPIQNFISGAYLLLMHSPTQKFSAKFVIQR